MPRDPTGAGAAVRRHATTPWALPEDAGARLELAKGYPYAVPARSYLFRDGEVRPIEEADFAGRTAVLGHGSNRAPSQLARKFARFSGRDAEIPVTFVWLEDYDVVYSAHVTTYGAIASTLQAAPGCRVRVALTWLDDRQLERMHETEGHYGFGHLERVTAEAEDGPPADRHAIWMYLSDHGCLTDEGRPLGLAAVPAENRPHRALQQPEALELVRRRTDPAAALDDFILQAVADPETRWRRIERLRATAAPSEVPHFRRG